LHDPKYSPVSDRFPIFKKRFQNLNAASVTAASLETRASLFSGAAPRPLFETPQGGPADAGTESPTVNLYGNCLGSSERRGSVMRNTINIDHKHSSAILQEIGERLRQSLRAERELPASFRKQLDRLYELEGQSPSILSDELRCESRDRSRFTKSWGRIIAEKLPWSNFGP
jgi:hypothetical protein